MKLHFQLHLQIFTLIGLDGTFQQVLPDLRVGKDLLLLFNFELKTVLRMHKSFWFPKKHSKQIFFLNDINSYLKCMIWEILSLFNQAFKCLCDLCLELRPNFQLVQVTTYTFWGIQEKKWRLSLFHWQNRHETFQELIAYVKLILHTLFKSINLIHEYTKIQN